LLTASSSVPIEEGCTNLACARPSGSRGVASIPVYNSGTIAIKERSVTCFSTRSSGFINEEVRIGPRTKEAIIEDYASACSEARRILGKGTSGINVIVDFV